MRKAVAVVAVILFACTFGLYKWATVAWLILAAVGSVVLFVWMWRR